MKLSSNLLVFCGSLVGSFVAAESLSFFGSQSNVQGTELDVPGESPLQFCSPGRDADLLEIEHVNLYPNPPVPGQNLTIEAVGTFKEEIEEGAKVALQVKYGLIRLVNTEADLCQQITNVDLECPLQKGKTVVSKEVAIPANVPPGKYTVLADVYTEDKRRITCLTAQVVFSRQSERVDL